jgi:hypothetical protein
MAFTSAALHVPANAAHLTRERVAEPYWCRIMHPASADGQGQKARQRT